MNKKAAKYLGLARIALGSIFLWAFFDKLFGLGFSTCRDPKTDVVNTMCEKAMINGGSPTTGFLKGATHGPFADFYQSMAGSQLVDILFMSGLLLIGIALVLGIGIKLATLFGSLLMLMMWSSMLPPENNPILDEHIVYILVLLTIGAANADQKFGLRSWWVKLPTVKRLPILQ